MLCSATSALSAAGPTTNGSMAAHAQKCATAAREVRRELAYQCLNKNSLMCHALSELAASYEALVVSLGQTLVVRLRTAAP